VSVVEGNVNPDTGPVLKNSLEKIGLNWIPAVITFSCAKEQKGIKMEQISTQKTRGILRDLFTIILQTGIRQKYVFGSMSERYEYRSNFKSIY
jgi:hypothetical protein